MPSPLVPPFQLCGVRVPRAALGDASGFRFDGDAFALADLDVDANGVLDRLVPSVAEAGD